MTVGIGRWSIVLALALVATNAALATNFAPSSWAAASLCAWLAHTTVTGVRGMTTWEQRHLLWGVTSLLAFAHFLVLDPSFQSWADVFFFCGRRLEYCSCGFRWNTKGWVKAAVLWNFVLSSALALQKLVITLGLNGLLPGEDLVTKESFISIGWRLIPYWLNNWEQQWGAECSSMIFELPHFALELLVVLPCAQIIAARLKILAQPHVRLPGRRPAAAAVGAAAGGEGQAAQAQQQQQPGLRGLAGHHGPGQGQAQQHFIQRQQQQGAGFDDEGDPGSLVPDPLRCVWVHDSAQRRLLPRLRANTRMMAVLVLITGVAMFNAIVMPLALEGQVRRTLRSEQILRLSDDLAFAAGKGRLAEMARWYEGFIDADLQRAALSAAAAAANSSYGGGTSRGGGAGGNGTAQQGEEGGGPFIAGWAEGEDVGATNGGGINEGGSDKGVPDEHAPATAQQHGARAEEWPPALAPLLSWAARQQAAAAAAGAGGEGDAALAPWAAAAAAPNGAAGSGGSPNSEDLAALSAAGLAIMGGGNGSSLPLFHPAEHSPFGAGSGGGGRVAAVPGAALGKASLGDEGNAAEQSQEVEGEGGDEDEDSDMPLHASASSSPNSASALAVSVLAMRVAGGAPWPNADNASLIATELAGSEMGAAHAVDARLAVLCTLWEPLVPMHWLRAMHLAGNSTNTPLQQALQFRPRPATSALLSLMDLALKELRQGRGQEVGKGEGEGPQGGLHLDEAVLKLGEALVGLASSGGPAHGGKRAAAAGAAKRAAGAAPVGGGSRGGGEGEGRAGRQRGLLQAGREAASGSSSGGGGAVSGVSAAGLARILLSAAALSDLDLHPNGPQVLGERWLGEHLGWPAEQLQHAQAQAQAAAASAGVGTAGADGGQQAERGQRAQQGQQGDLAWLRARQALWEEKGCLRTSLMSPLYRMLNKHAVELRRMSNPEHRSLIPLVESSLAVMRLSCENFFSLAAVFLGYLLFRDPPPAARRAIVGVARLSHAFQRAILYAFPAVCWSYGAGFVFSSFVSVVFWTGPLLRALERMRTAATSVLPRSWHPATPEELERMGGQCAICWGEMGGEAGGEQGEGEAEQQQAATATAEGAVAADGSGQGPAALGGDAAAGIRLRHCEHTQHTQQQGGQQQQQQGQQQQQQQQQAEPGWAAAEQHPWQQAQHEFELGEEHAAAAQQAALLAGAAGGAGWGDLRAAAGGEGEEGDVGASTRAMGLPCGHAYHESCLLQWLHQCYGQARQPSCPMCQATIRLRVSYRLPFAAAPPAQEQGEGLEHGQGEQPQELGIHGIRELVRALQDDFRNRFEPVLLGMDHQDFLAWEEELAGIAHQDERQMPPVPAVPPQQHPPPPQQQQQQELPAMPAAPMGGAGPPAAPHQQHQQGMDGGDGGQQEGSQRGPNRRMQRQVSALHGGAGGQSIDEDEDASEEGPSACASQSSLGSGWRRHKGWRQQYEEMLREEDSLEGGEAEEAAAWGEQQPVGEVAGVDGEPSRLGRILSRRKGRD